MYIRSTHLVSQPNFIRSAECILVNCDCTWNVFPITGTFKPEGRVYHSSIMAGNQLVLFGGWKPSTQQVKADTYACVTARLIN